MLAGEASLQTQEEGPSIQQIEEMRKLTLNWNIKHSTAAEILNKIPHILLRYSNLPFVLRWGMWPRICDVLWFGSLLPLKT